MNATKLNAELENFTGTEQYHFIRSAPNVKYTDGVSYLVRKTACLWLISRISASQDEHKDKPFQLWKVNSSKVQDYVEVTMQEDDGQPLLVEEEFDGIYFPLDGLKLYCNDGIILLPSEY